MRGAILVFRDTRKRRQFEEQATHAQKMEAMARLAGSVSGDFNNMLTVIAGYAELLRGEIVPGSAARKYVDEIIYAGERAAAVTRHLLAFSRGTLVDAKILDLNLMLTHMEPMLRRLLGQNIELLILPAPGLGTGPSGRRANRAGHRQPGDECARCDAQRRQVGDRDRQRRSG